MHYNCLIVDDEVDLAKMTAEYFQMFDVSTAYVDSAEACFDFLKDNTIDLLLLDINLGEGSGFEVCRKIREEYQLPILFISARQSDDDVLVALSIGGDDYIKKPLRMKKREEWFWMHLPCRRCWTETELSSKLKSLRF